MTEKKYTVQEINRMRQTIWMVENMQRVGFAFSVPDLSARVEDMLRTYMQNGTEPEELDDMHHRLVRSYMQKQDSQPAQ